MCNLYIHNNEKSNLICNKFYWIFFHTLKVLLASSFLVINIWKKSAIYDERKPTQGELQAFQ